MMICPNCKSEIEDGNIYCPKCGKEIQLVPVYSMLEEEIFQDQIPPEHKTVRTQKEEVKKPREGHRRRKKHSHGWILWILLLFAAIGAGIYFFVNYSFHHSYSYQMSRAIDAYNAEEYDQALEYGKQALFLQENDLDALLLIAQSYEGKKDYEKEEEHLLTALKNYPDEEKVYRALIGCYTLSDSYDKLYNLAESCGDEDLQELFEGHIVESPLVSEESGSYSEPLSIELTTEDSSLSIYYTLDGTTPSRNSEKYSSPIQIGDGEISLVAVAYDEDGHYSLPTTEEYNVDADAPSDVTISLASGTYYYDNEIVITADSGCTIYYAWDTTDEDDLTTEYTGSLSLLEGNHVLAVMVEDSYGQTSSVITRSYIYLPSEE